jgi:hypothetical protein
MEITAAVQILSFGILAGAGAVVVLDFVKARQEFSRVFVAWREEREEAR